MIRCIGTKAQLHFLAVASNHTFRDVMVKLPEEGYQVSTAPMIDYTGLILTILRMRPNLEHASVFTSTALHAFINVSVNCVKCAMKLALSLSQHSSLLNQPSLYFVVAALVGIHRVTSRNREYNGT